jgi:phage shock protein E
MKITRSSALAVVVALAVSACGGSSTDSVSDTPEASAPASVTAGITLVSVDGAAATIAAAPDDLVILDVRTPEEFNEGHIEGAVMIDFYRDDFSTQLAELDPDVPYVLYCRSGNRSGQTTAIMEELGFQSVQDVDGGSLAWQAAGLPLVTE